MIFMADAEKTEKVRVEARVILDKFAEELAKIKTSNFIVKNGDAGVRDELEGAKCDKEFRTIMFKNAPNTDEGCLIVEKGAWT